jgi:hypothetical protein
MDADARGPPAIPRNRSQTHDAPSSMTAQSAAWPLPIELGQWSGEFESKVVGGIGAIHALSRQRTTTADGRTSRGFPPAIAGCLRSITVAILFMELPRMEIVVPATAASCKLHPVVVDARYPTAIPKRARERSGSQGGMAAPTVVRE